MWPWWRMTEHPCVQDTFCGGLAREGAIVSLSQTRARGLSHSAWVKTWANLRSRIFWGQEFFCCWQTAREFVEVPKCGTTSTINWVLQMEGLEGSHFRHFFALNLESAWASSCQPTHQDGPDLYRLQSTTNPSFSKIYTHSDPEGESQLRSLYRSGKAFLQEQGSLVILKI